MIPVRKPDIEKQWYETLKNEFESPYFAEIKSFLIEEKKTAYRISTFTTNFQRFQPHSF